MNIVGKVLLSKFKAKHADSHSVIDSWIIEVEDAVWVSPLEVKKRFIKASIVDDQNVVFNIKGNSYRLWVRIDYRNKIVLVKKIGTHSEYMTWKIK